MNDKVRVIGDVSYVPLAIVNPGDALFFTGPKRIAVETWALDWGQHEFDYELNSRPVGPDGRPIAIATTQEALAREFMEKRVVTRQPIPVSVGFPNGMVPKVELTMGEVSPQIYTSRVTGLRVGWSLRFRGHRLVAASTGTMSAAKNAAKRNPNAELIGRATIAGQSAPSGFDYLMVRVPAADLPRFRILHRGFGVMDLIGTEQSWFQKWVSRITGG
jgi:hypothetical protein